MACFSDLIGEYYTPGVEICKLNGLCQKDLLLLPVSDRGWPGRPKLRGYPKKPYKRHLYAYADA